MSTAELICLLHAIVAEPAIEAVGEEECLNWGYLDDRHELIQQAVDMANAVLVDENGERDWSAEIALTMAGFNVRCLERDRNGWLAGGIETEKGIIAYG
jgi:hypothetical protein